MVCGSDGVLRRVEMQAVVRMAPSVWTAVPRYLLQPRGSDSLSFFESE